MRCVTPLLAASLLMAVSTGAMAQSPPSLQEYPLRDRVFGPGGAIFPNYVTPSESTIAYVTGAGGGIAFGAATVDFLCQQEQRPVITVVRPPASGKVQIQPGQFVARGTDAGSTFCLGYPVNGTVVRYVGRAPKGGTQFTIRVTYPHLGAWYDHVVQVPGR